MNVEATIVITTRNRKEDLRRALRSAMMQDCPCEVLVVDDASTDDTAGMVRSEFPEVRLVESREQRGYIVHRNQAARLASGRYIVSIDDDAEFSSASVVRQTLANFDDERIRAVSIPHKDIRISDKFKTPIASAPGQWVVSGYVGTAHAVERSVFLQLGGYREALHHNTEERDFCIRLLNFGYVTRLGTADTILHYISPIRDIARAFRFQRRNDLCHALWNVPLPHLLFHFPGTILSGLIFGLRNRCLKLTLSGYKAAPRVMWATRSCRAPVTAKIYQLFRKLNQCGVLPLQEVKKSLGPPGVWNGLESGADAAASGVQQS